MAAHIVKYEYENGIKLQVPILWCGRKYMGNWAFKDVQHVALSVGGSIQPCKLCIKAIIKTLSKEL